MMASKPKLDLVGGMKELFNIAKTDFVTNSKELKQDFKEIMELARTKRRSKQDAKPLSTLDANIDPDAGAELLSHYRHQWSSIHKSIQTSADVAATVSDGAGNIDQNCRQIKTVIAKCNAEFSLLPDVIAQVEKAHEKILKIEGSIKSIEDAITEYCHVAAKAEAVKKKRQAKADFDKHQTERQLEVQRYELSLFEEQKSLATDKERHEQEEQQERQRSYSEMFEIQMSEYKEKGELERPITEVLAMTTLDNITLDDTDGTAKLDQFLCDVGPDAPVPVVVEDDTEESVGGSKPAVNQDDDEYADAVDTH